MYVEFDLHVVKQPHTAVSIYWNRYFFVGSPSQNQHINALASTYMRLAEAAIVEYDLGCRALREVWADETSLSLRAMHRSISHFESCVSDMHRAISAYRRLRRHRAMDPLSLYLAKHKPDFATDAIANQIRIVRDTIHHLEEMVVEDRIPDGRPIALRPNGVELAHPSEEGQTVKTFDRLEIGVHQLTFHSIATWLREISSVAAEIAEYEPNRAQTP